MTPADRHLIHRLVAFFATGDSIVSNNLVLNLYQHLNAPEARMYLSRQLYEEALHVQFYLTLLDNYLPDPSERFKAFAAVENIPAIKKKADFCFKWIDSIQDLKRIETREQRRQFLLNQICFAACIEGLFFFAAFAYVYYFRSRGLLPGLASGTNWVFRDESCHMEFAFECVRTCARRSRTCSTTACSGRSTTCWKRQSSARCSSPRTCCPAAWAGISTRDMRQYLQHCADQHFAKLGMPKRYDVRNPLPFMELQDVQELTNFFERRVSAYQLGVQGEVGFDHAF